MLPSLRVSGFAVNHPPLTVRRHRRGSRRDRLTIARRFNAGYAVHRLKRVPEGRLKPRNDLSPHILRIVFDVVFFQKDQELFFETSFAMVLGLRSDVGDRVSLL